MRAYAMVVVTTAEDRDQAWQSVTDELNADEVQMVGNAWQVELGDEYDSYECIKQRLALQQRHRERLQGMSNDELLRWLRSPKMFSGDPADLPMLADVEREELRRRGLEVS